MVDQSPPIGRRLTKYAIALATPDQVTITPRESLTARTFVGAPDVVETGGGGSGGGGVTVPLSSSHNSGAPMPASVDTNCAYPGVLLVPRSESVRSFFPADCCACT